MRVDFNLAEDLLPFVGIMVILAPVALLVLVITAFAEKKRNNTRKQRIDVTVRDWQPTGNINFLDGTGNYERTQPEKYWLEVEEDRIVALIGGGETREVRHRFATLDEAVDVIKLYKAGQDKAT